MQDKIKSKNDFACTLSRLRNFEDKIKLQGHFFLEHIRDRKVIAEIPFENGSTTVGRNHLFDVGFNSGAANANWYLSLLNATSGTPTLSAADTMASHAGWTEFILYDEAARPAWTRGAASGGAVASTAPSIFTISSGLPVGAAVGGGFVTSNSTKNGTTGILWAHGLFPGNVIVQTGDQFRLNYTTSLSGS